MFKQYPIIDAACTEHCFMFIIIIYLFIIVVCMYPFHNLVTNVFNLT